MPPSARGHPGMEQGDARLQRLPPAAANLGKREHLHHPARPPPALEGAQDTRTVTRTSQLREFPPKAPARLPYHGAAGLLEDFELQLADPPACPLDLLLHHGGGVAAVGLVEALGGETRMLTRAPSPSAHPTARGEREKAQLKGAAG